jgi:hypothetical protein
LKDKARYENIKSNFVNDERRSIIHLVYQEI